MNKLFEVYANALIRCYGKKGEELKVQQIKNIPWFTKDPVYGSERGPVLDV